MPVKTNIQFDAINNTSMIDFYVGVEFVTSISYTSLSAVVIAERLAEVTMPIADFRSWVSDCINWSDETVRRLSVVQGERRYYKMECKEGQNQTDRYEGLIDSYPWESKYKRSTGEVILQPRPEFILSWREFSLFILGYRFWLDRLVRG